MFPSQMWRSWWQAHELEFVLGAIALGLVLVFAGFRLVAHITRERRKKRKDGLL